MEARAENDVLIINETKRIRFPYRINKIVIWEDRLAIVCTDTWRLSGLERDIADNVYAFDEEGRFKWQMEHTTREGGGHTGVTNPDGKLYVFDFNSYRYTLDPDTGRILEEGQPSGRPW